MAFQPFLHNAQQANRFTYTEECVRAGSHHQPVWSCFVVITAVFDPALNNIVSYTAIGTGVAKQEAREEAAKNALGALGFDITQIQT